LFACAPHDDSLSRRLTGEVETRLRDSVVQAFGTPEQFGRQFGDREQPPSREIRAI
jgi:hypothetical protein